MTETQYTLLAFSVSIGFFISIFIYLAIKKRINTSILLLQLIMIGVLTFTEGYWAINPYDESPSSSCLECMLELDLIWLSVIAVFFIGLFLLISDWLRTRKRLRLIINISLLIGYWLLINNMLFVERVTSWSTFTTAEEWISTITISFFPVLVCGSIYFGISYFLAYKKNEK